MTSSKDIMNMDKLLKILDLYAYALEITRDKRVDFNELLASKELKDYNQYMYPHMQLTEDEYKLLKKVL